MVRRKLWGSISSDQQSLPDQDRLQRHEKRLKNMRDSTITGTPDWSYGPKIEDRATILYPDRTSDGGESHNSSEKPLDNTAGSSHQTEVSGEHRSSDQTLTQYRLDLLHPDFPALEAKLKDCKITRNYIRKDSIEAMNTLRESTSVEIQAIYPTLDEKLRTFTMIRSKPIAELSDLEHRLGLVLRSYLIDKVTKEKFREVTSQKYFVDLPRANKKYIYNALDYLKS